MEELSLHTTMTEPTRPNERVHAPQQKVPQMQQRSGVLQLRPDAVRLIK